MPEADQAVVEAAASSAVCSGLHKAAAVGSHTLLWKVANGVVVMVAERSTVGVLEVRLDRSCWDCRADGSSRVDSDMIDSSETAYHWVGLEARWVGCVRGCIVTFVAMVAGDDLLLPILV